jgi:hypothetical protein
MIIMQSSKLIPPPHDRPKEGEENAQWRQAFLLQACKRKTQGERRILGLW